MRKIAEQNLKTHTVMALRELTVQEFVGEVLDALKVPPLKSNTKIKIGFFGKSTNFPVRFRANELIDTVYTKICSIEEQRALAR